MKKNVVIFLFLVIGVCGIWGTGQGDAKASAGQWPQKAIQIIVGNSPGSDTDFNARAYATRLDKVLGQPAVVVNVPGSNGMVGADQVKNSAPDGYTVNLWNSAFLVAMAIDASDFTFHDFEVACIAARDDGNAVCVNAKSPYMTLQDLIDDSIQNPGKVTFAAPVAGNSYLAGCLLNSRAGAKFNIVDAGGTAERAAALLGGHVTTTLNAMAQSAQYRASGDFRLLAILGRERNSVYGDIPTAIEEGIDVAVLSPFFFLFPKGTPKEIVEKFNDAIKTVNEMPDYREHIRNTLQARPVFIRGQDAVNYLQAQYEEILTVKHLMK